jgi:hypothetical protein
MLNASSKPFLMGADTKVPKKTLLPNTVQAKVTLCHNNISKIVIKAETFVFVKNAFQKRTFEYRSVKRNTRYNKNLFETHDQIVTDQQLLKKLKQFKELAQAKSKETSSCLPMCCQQDFRTFEISSNNVVTEID